MRPTACIHAIYIWHFNLALKSSSPFILFNISVYIYGYTCVFKWEKRVSDIQQ